MKQLRIWDLVGGIPTPLKNDGVSNSWDDDTPHIWKVIKFMFQTTNQGSIYIYIYIYTYIYTYIYISGGSAIARDI